MQFTKNQIKILKNMSQFENKTLITPKYFFTTTYNHSTAIFYKLKNKLDFEKPIELYNTSEFINILNTFTNHDIQEKENHLQIINLDNNAKVKYSAIADEIGTMEEDANKAKEFLKKNKGKEKFNFDFGADEINTIRKISNILKLTDCMIDFDTSNNEYKMILGNINFMDKEEDEIMITSDSYEVIIPEDKFTKKSKDSLKKIFNVDIFKMIILDDYNVQVFDNFIKLFKEDDEGELIYIFSFY